MRVFITRTISINDSNFDFLNRIITFKLCGFYPVTGCNICNKPVILLLLLTTVNPYDRITQLYTLRLIAHGKMQQAVRIYLDQFIHIRSSVTRSCHQRHSDDRKLFSSNWCCTDRCVPWLYRRASARSAQYCRRLSLCRCFRNSQSLTDERSEMTSLGLVLNKASSLYRLWSSALPMADEICDRRARVLIDGANWQSNKNHSKTVKFRLKPHMLDQVARHVADIAYMQNSINTSLHARCRLCYAAAPAWGIVLKIATEIIKP